MLMRWLPEVQIELGKRQYRPATVLTFAWITRSRTTPDGHTYRWVSRRTLEKDRKTGLLRTVPGQPCAVTVESFLSYLRAKLQGGRTRC